MKLKTYIKFSVALILMLGLFAFSSVKNSNRPVKEVEIQFNGERNLFITKEAVSKLLIQNSDSVTNTTKDILDLNVIEERLNANEMIKSSQVYMLVNGKLIANVSQRQPIARVILSSQQFYIDDLGTAMPLSRFYTARVPIVTGYINKDSLQGIYELTRYISEDVFLKKHVIQIKKNKQERYTLKFRNYDFDIELGSTKQLNTKINNLKAFYKKALKDKLLHDYSRINLEFNKQVVCTKK